VPIFADRVKIDFRARTCQHTAMSNRPISRLRTLWLGETARAEFAAAAEVLLRETDCTVRPVAEAEAIGAGAPPGVFDLVVAAESFPDEVSPAVFKSLRRRHPASRWIRVVGPWCDGEVRSAAPPAATLRVAWHRAAAWLSRQFERLRAGERPEFDDPPTFDEADRVMATRPRHAGDGRRATPAIWAEEPAAREWLLAACDRLAEMRPPNVEASGTDGPEIVLCDLPTADGPAEQLAQIRQGYPRAALVVLVGFARPRDVQALYEAGAAMVLPKPVAIADLEAGLDAVAGRLDRR
jgi:CheY-like chemotaxis protein